MYVKNKLLLKELSLIVICRIQLIWQLWKVRVFTLLCYCLVKSSCKWC